MDAEKEKERRYGKFRIRREHILEPFIEEILVQMRFVPFKVEMLYYADELEYCGISHLFTPVANGEEPPSYLIEYTTNVDKTISGVKAIRR